MYQFPNVQMAQQQGLVALVADGVHNLQPDATNKRGQLYTVRGVRNNTIDVPLLYAKDGDDISAYFLPI
ncbi:hypothetical protein Y032_0301g1827 [Ancylostoma ceylanicum]|uniref:Uncharacterized protein n=1 Tax=Ancylostoma ceylanicum TaxID=53326 RepID=A0A016S3N2_9BILA|nr:hypothetical protein Y032_0301g1827 [Ancylostoma ceylanicum]